MYDELNTKYLEQQHELQNIALTARQILDEKIDLKEQVERLTAVFVPENLILRADVERLTKAGDAVCESPYLLETDPAVISWRAATEGNKP
jgi:hypothetical protein